MDSLKKLIREIPDFPKPGILFYDITTLLGDKDGFREMVDKLCEHYNGRQVDKVAGIEARGFIFGPALAYRLKAGFIPIRKPNKLPWKRAEVIYELEYGTDKLEMHRGRRKTRRAHFDLRRSASHRRHRRRRNKAGPPTRRRGRGRRLRRRTKFPERPRQTPRRRRLLADAIRQVNNSRQSRSKSRLRRGAPLAAPAGVTSFSRLCVPLPQSPRNVLTPSASRAA